MQGIEIRAVGNDRLEEFIVPITTSLGYEPNAEWCAATATIPEFDLRIAALEGDSIVGAAGSFAFDLTAVGRSVPTTGLTMVAVLPTHRRRGILTAFDARVLLRGPAQRTNAVGALGLGGLDLRPLRLWAGVAYAFG